MHIFAVANQKGGVAKTATVASLAACLSQLGQRVLAIDSDPQGNLSMAMGAQASQGMLSTYDLLLGEKVGVGDCALRVPWGKVDVVPADVRLAAAEVERRQFERFAGRKHDVFGSLHRLLVRGRNHRR